MTLLPEAHVHSEDAGGTQLGRAIQRERMQGAAIHVHAVPSMRAGG